MGARKGVGLRLEDAGRKSGILAQRVRVPQGKGLVEALLRGGWPSGHLLEQCRKVEQNELV